MAKAADNRCKSGAYEIAAASDRLAVLVMGTNDLAKELHAVQIPGREPMLTALSIAVLAARAAGKVILDGVYNDITDAAGFEAAGRVVPGAADRSYGIHVAKLAGLPGAVLARANEVLKRLEEGRGSPRKQNLVSELPLFARAPQPQIKKSDALREKLAVLAPDDLSPREAHTLIYELKQLAAKADEI